MVVLRDSHKASGSGRAIATFLGNSSPKSICTTVEKAMATTAPSPTEMNVGTPTPPSIEPIDWPMSGSAT